MQIIDVITDGLTLFYGEAATGKTCFALEIAKKFIEKYKKNVVYFDPKNRAVYRLSSFPASLLEKIILIKPKDLRQQKFFLNRINKIIDISLVVIDDITFYYRIERKNFLEFARQLALIKTLSKIKKIPFILIAEVYSKAFHGNQTLEVVGGDIIKEVSSRIIKFSKNKTYYITFNNKKIFFKITDKEVILQNHQV